MISARETYASLMQQPACLDQVGESFLSIKRPTGDQDWRAGGEIADTEFSTSIPL